MAGLSDDEFATWVSNSCARHGVPVKVTDARIVADVAVLLSGGASRPSGAKRRWPAAPPRSESPYDVDSGGVDIAGSANACGDDGAVYDGVDDGGLPGQVERGPLCA